MGRGQRCSQRPPGPDSCHSVISPDTGGAGVKDYGAGHVAQWSNICLVYEVLRGKVGHRGGRGEGEERRREGREEEREGGSASLPFLPLFLHCIYFILT